MSNESANSPLIALTPKLQNRIYEYIVVKEHSIVIGSCLDRVNSIKRHVSHSMAPPAVTRTCSQLRCETFPIHYGSTHFYVDAYHVADIWHIASAFTCAFEWFVRMGAEQRSMVRRLSVRTRGLTLRTAFVADVGDARFSLECSGETVDGDDLERRPESKHYKLIIKG